MELTAIEPRRHRLEGFADIAGHGPHLFRQTVRHTPHPFDQRRQRHSAGLVQRNALQPGCPRGSRQAGAVTIRANILFQKFFHPLHALFVLDLGKRVFHRVNGVEIGEVQFSGLTGVFVVIKSP